jgi:A/G-specific adenine glycosylase
VPVEPDTQVARDLLNWYDRHARALPWRHPDPDPWAVLLSETMLQQTTVATVAPRFPAFLARFPSPEAMAGATEADVLGAWAGLGYYARARNLHAAARTIAAAGAFPRTEAALAALPGVGAYTAAAVSAIAFGARTTVIDANVARVGARLLALAEPMPAGRKALAAGLAPLVPAARPGDFAQALMDLGATICTPRAPRCLACPVRRHCRAAARGTPEAFPGRIPKAARPQRHGHVWWIERNGAVALVRRPRHGLLGGMLGLPGSDWTPVRAPFQPPWPAHWRALDRAVTHGFTHFILTLDIHRLKDEVVQPPFPDDIVWHPVERLADAGLPTLFRKVADAVLASAEPTIIETRC